MPRPSPSACTPAHLAASAPMPPSLACKFTVSAGRDGPWVSQQLSGSDRERYAADLIEERAWNVAKVRGRKLRRDMGNATGGGQCASQSCDPDRKCHKASVTSQIRPGVA